MNDSRVDTQRQYICGDCKTDNYPMDVPMHPGRRELGAVKVYIRNIPDNKYHEIENLYAAALEMVSDAALARDNEIKEIESSEKRKLKPLEKLAIDRKHNPVITEASAAVVEVKKEFVKYAVMGWEPFKADSETVHFEGAKETVDGQELVVCSAADIENLCRGLNGYGKRRATLLNCMFEVVFDFQNGILTGAEEIWRRNDAGKSQEEKPDPKTASKEGQGEDAQDKPGKGDSNPL